MTDEGRDGARVRVPPPLVFVAAIALGFALHTLVWPLPVDLGAWRIAAIAVAALIAITLFASSLLRFWQTKQNPEPWKPTPEIITTGIYAYTRNPMYLGMVALQTAVGLWLRNGWILALIPLVMFAIYHLAIRHEEQYLEQKFGEPYRRYLRSVRRWV